MVFREEGAVSSQTHPAPPTACAGVFMRKSRLSSEFQLTTRPQVRDHYRDDMERKGGKLKDIDEMFVKQFLKNGNVTTPTESVLISTNEFRALTNSLRENRWSHWK